MSPAARERMLDGLRRRNPEILAQLTRRSLTVTRLKRALPLAAVALLLALVLAPSWHFGPDANRVTYHIQAAAGDEVSSRMQGAAYHGTDLQGQPFTITADSAADEGGDDMALTAPVGDITLKSGAWLELRSDSGMFHQKAQKLGLAGHVTLYRNDGTTMVTSKADIDLRSGGAQGADPVQAQGPFGTLNAANGFRLINRGAEMTFLGPVTMTLSQAQ